MVGLSGNPPFGVDHGDVARLKPLDRLDPPEKLFRLGLALIRPNPHAVVGFPAQGSSGDLRDEPLILQSPGYFLRPGGTGV